MNRLNITGVAVILVAVFLTSLFPMASLVIADGTTLSTEYGPPSTADTWQQFTVPLTADTFGTDTTTFNQVMSSVTQIRIRMEMHTGNDVGGLDDVHIGTQYSSNFNSSLESWSAAGDGTMEWVPSGGISGGYLQISDWASGDWHWATAPASWSGNWSNLIGSSLVFHMKTDRPSYAAEIQISSDDVNRLIISADPMLVPPAGTSNVTVSPSPTSSSQLSVSLNSSDTGCITCPSSMTIGAGQTSGQFLATAASGAEVGCKSVITASTSGYDASRITLNVGDSPVTDGGVTTNSPEADCIIQIGDMDNLGFGWPTGFDVFSGNSTPSHGYPWELDPSDPAGTDRIMVGTGVDGNAREGYSGSTSRPDNLPQIISTSFNCPGVSINSAIIQMFVDDFQAPAFGSHFQVELNGTRAPFIESVINALRQTGPIGKLISVQVPSEYLYLLSSGNFSIYIDDPTTGVGDGYAVDFVRLLINPDLSASSYTGMITGKVTDKSTGQALQGVKVSAGGTAETQTNSNGEYTLSRVPAGLVVISASIPGYINGSTSVDLVAGGNATANISLSPLPTGTGDGDSDGVPDNQDQCPNTPAGDTVGSTGCTISSGGGGSNGGDVDLTCSNGDNDEGGCCCFHGEHTYTLDPQCVSSVTARFDTGRGYGCRSTVSFQINDGSGWRTIDSYEAVSSSDAELFVIETEVQVGEIISGFRISDGCTCCIDSSHITLHVSDNCGSGGTGGGTDIPGVASLVVESRTVIPGGAVTVPVKLENVKDVGSLNFNITYDSSIVKVSGVDKGSLLSGISFVANPNESGIIRFGFATQKGIRGTGSIGHIVFEAVGVAGSSSPLTITEVESTNSSGNAVTLQASNGAVDIISNGLLGDYNGDGLVTELDALAALRMSVKLLTEDLILDMDQNGRVTAEDARQILSISVRGS